MLLLALVFYLKYEAPEDEQNFPMVMELLRAGEVHEDDDAYVSPLDVLFNRLEEREPEHIAVKYYRDYHSGSAKTLKSIQITLAARLEKFNLESLASLTATDELDLPSLGEKKTALFALIPDNDTSFNFLVSILYTQLFQQLFFLADHKYGGSLPVHVHFIMDEFANVSLPDDFDKILSVMRSREVSVSIILQNLAQLKALFEKQWESIVGNCDEFLYLGGNEQSTHKYVSELLGKETIDTNTYGKSSGRSGNYSTNYQISGRELLTPDEVRLLDNKYAILFIRGERPVVVIQNNLGNKYSPTVIIAPLTEVIKKADLPTHITIFRNDFLKYDSMILLEQLRTIDKSRLISYLGKLKDNQLQKIDNALIKTLSINIIGYLFSLGIGEYNEKKNERIYSDYYFKETKTRDSIKSNKQKRSKRNGH